MELFTTLRKISARKEDFKKWELDEEKNDKKREMYYQKKHFTPQEIENAKQLGQRLVDTISIMDEKSEDVAENVETATQMGVGIFTMIGNYTGLGLGGLLSYKNIKNNMFSFTESNSLNFETMLKKIYKGILPALGLSFLGSITASIIGQIYATKLQIEGSRVGRHQARNELDNKNFILYNEEQLAKAKAIAKNIPDIKEKKFLDNAHSIVSMLNPIGYFKELNNVIKKHETSNQERKKLNKTNVNANLSPEETANAEKQQKLLNNIIKKINNRAEEYSENMETTAGVIFGSSFLLGGVLGNVANKITDKIIKLFDPIGMFSKNPLAQKFARGMTGGLLVSIATVPILLKLQKNAARAGRFEVKQELLQDPRNFIAIDEKEMKDIPDPDVKPKSLFSRIMNVFSVIPKSIKSAIAYDKYKDTELKELKKLNQAFKQIEVTPEQLKNGEKLKDRVFKSFEKIDDYSQAYSEKAEVVCEIGQSVLGMTSSLIFYAPFIGYLYDKPSLATIVKKASSLLSKSMDTNLFKKYIGRVQNNIGNIIEKQSVKGEIPNFIEKHKDTLTKLFNKEDIPNDALQSLITDFKNSDLKKYWSPALEQKFGDIKRIDQLFEYITPENLKLISKNIKKPNLTEYFNKDEYILSLKNEINGFSTEDAFREFAEEHFIFKKIYNETLTRKDVTKILDNAQIILNNEEGKKLIETINQKLQESPEKVISLFMNNPGKLIKALDIKKYIGAAGLSYAVINIAGISAISAYLADIQKKAGRLGVMEALEEINKETQNQLSFLSTPNASNISFSNMNSFLSSVKK